MDNPRAASRTHTTDTHETGGTPPPPASERRRLIPLTIAEIRRLINLPRHDNQAWTTAFTGPPGAASTKARRDGITSGGASACRPYSSSPVVLAQHIHAKSPRVEPPPNRIPRPGSKHSGVRESDHQN